MTNKELEARNKKLRAYYERYMKIFYKETNRMIQESMERLAKRIYGKIKQPNHASFKALTTI